jgi:hypothetical protein
MRKSLIVMVLILFCASQALAWHDGGHKLVAAIAFKRLTPDERKKVLEILKHHPRFDPDFDDQMPGSVAAGSDERQQEWLFQQAAVWPDMARQFHGNLKDTYHRPLWHYINRPIFLTDADRTAMEGHLHINLSLDPPATMNKEMNVIQTIRLARKVLKDPMASKMDKGLMLSWLFHTVGDIHQPLHSSALFSSQVFKEGDHGGNLVNTKEESNLHTLWDHFPGDRLSFKNVHNKAKALMAVQDWATAGTAAAGELNESKWLDESFELATTKVYDIDLMAHLRVVEMDGSQVDFPPFDLDDEYLKDADKICDKRVVEAGYRLGEILKQLVQ